MKVLHVITDLTRGGAERMLEKLCAEGAVRGDPAPKVISLRSLGDMGAEISKHGVEVVALGANGPISGVRAFWRLFRIVRRERPDIIQTWLYLADLVGALVAVVARRGKVVWNLRCTDPGESRRTRQVVAINAKLSSWLPASIIACAEAVKTYHVGIGFDQHKLQVIPNGFEIARFIPDAQAELRHSPLRILAIGRADPLKDYPNLIRAFAMVIAEMPDVRLSIWGRNVTKDPALRAELEEYHLAAQVKLHEQIDDVRAAMREADLYVQSSASEGFPNVLGEAMLMELPCIATDVGETRDILGDIGEIVPKGNSERMAFAILSLARLSVPARHVIGKAARRRITEHYGIDTIYDRYQAHYRHVIAS